MLRENLKDIVADIRSLSNGIKNVILTHPYTDERFVVIEGKPLDVYFAELADRIEAAHKRELETKDSVIQTMNAARDDELDKHRREVEALKRRRSELDAEITAKDEVIKRLDAEIRKYQEERELRIAAQKAKEEAM